MIFASLRDVISLRLFCLPAVLRHHAVAIAHTAECSNKLVSGFDLSVASLAITIAEPATVISHHKLHFPNISGWMVVIPYKARDITCEMVVIPCEARDITCEARGITCETRGITCETRGITALGALPYGPL